MDIRVETEASQNLHEEKVPLLVDSLLPKAVEKTLIQQAISQTFQSTAHLANLLPTGSVLSFQLLSPIFTSQGDCDAVGQYLTAGLIAICGLSCLLLSFTDSFKDQMGNVFYGLPHSEASVALFDENVVKCFYPTPSDKAKEPLTTLPIGIGVICSMLFITFPTKRHGIGFPLTAN
ncbi:hypothetical protein RJ639_044838 [Escallonia herrerae]|uniref:Uncharacterized protein n=1 Tax=Escallonia herrerae TaxID=1293975 RepID=A0AA88WBL4_9ASTE|nr:hypothetical protein RJ639_044838 [Escallonia herrerae]